MFTNSLIHKAELNKKLKIKFKLLEEVETEKQSTGSENIQIELDQLLKENDAIKDYTLQTSFKIRKGFEILKKYDRDLDVIINSIKKYGMISNSLKKTKPNMNLLIKYSDFIELNRIEDWGASDSK